MDRRMLGLGLLAAGAVLTVIGVLDDGWFADAHASVGLREITVCRGGQCASVALSDTPVDMPFSMAGNVAYFGGLLGAGLALAAGGMNLARIQLAGAVSPARLAIAFLGATALCGLIFVGATPDWLGEASMGIAAYLGIGGAASGASGAWLVYRDEQLTDEERARRAGAFE